MTDTRYKQLADVLQAIRDCTPVMQFTLDISLEEANKTVQGQLAISELVIEDKSYTTILIDGKNNCKVFKLYLFDVSLKREAVKLLCNGNDASDEDFTLLIHTLEQGLLRLRK